MSDSTPRNPSVSVSSISVTSGIATAFLSSAPTVSWLGYPIQILDSSGNPDGNGLFTVIAEQDTSPFFLKFPFNGSTTCSSCTATVVPSAYRVEVKGEPWRGLNGATLRPNTNINGINSDLDGVQLDGVVGGTVQNIHCEILNNCVRLTNGSASYGASIANITSGNPVSNAGLGGALYENDFNGGNSIAVSGLSIPSGTSTSLLIADRISSSLNSVVGAAIPLYTTGSTNSARIMQSCGVATLTPSTTPNTIALSCFFTVANSFCVATPVTANGTSAFTPTLISLDTTTARSVKITYTGGTGSQTGQVAVACSIP